MLRLVSGSALFLSVVAGCAASGEDVDTSEGAATFAPEEIRPLDGAKLHVELRCAHCHATDRKLIGPSYMQLEELFGAKAMRDADGGIVAGDATVARLVKSVLDGSQYHWGSVPMPKNPIGRDEADALVRWILDGGQGGEWKTR